MEMDVAFLLVFGSPVVLASLSRPTNRLFFFFTFTTLDLECIVSILSTFLGISRGTSTTFLCLESSFAKTCKDFFTRGVLEGRFSALGVLGDPFETIQAASRLAM